MPHPHLRVFFGPEDEETKPPASGQPRSARITVPLSEVLPTLSDAVNTRRAWLRDFQDDPVTISADLYEVLLAYRELRPTG